MNEEIIFVLFIIMFFFCCSAWCLIYEKWINFNQKQHITFVMQILESAIYKPDIKENSKIERFNPFTFKEIIDP